jgi:DNA processing protein
MNYEPRNLNILLHLSLINNVGPATVRRLLKKISLEDIYDIKINDIVQAGFCQEMACAIYHNLKDFSLLENELTAIEKNNVKLITQNCKDYPKSLLNFAAPLVLYCKGNVNLLNKTNLVAVVGSRKGSMYGKSFIERVIRPLSKFKIIISGGALGIDAWAHQAALDENQPTVAVLGSGFANLYPWQNIKLFERIIAENGLVITPFKMSAIPLANNFPARNSIVAGLAEACVVVQAACKSGALITAYSALEQGKDVYAVPGGFDDLLSQGCHKLLASGAKLATSVNDFLPYTQVVQTKINFELNDSLEDKILRLCQSPKTLEYLTNSLAANLQMVEDCLFDLLLAGKAKQDHAGLWQAVVN